MTTLRIAKTLVSSAVNGPGRRFVIWVQGCRLGCRGCFNPEFWDEAGGEVVNVADLAARILDTPGIEGVTFSGGEPMQQATGLLALVQLLQSTDLTFVCYTGHVYEELRQGRTPDILALLKHLDILIDGPFDESLKAALLWRGSRNQRVIFLTDRYATLAPIVASQGQREAELIVDSTGVHITGIFDPALWKKLQRKFQQ